MNKHVKQLLATVTVILVVVMSLLVILLIFGMIDRELFILMSLKMLGTLAVLTAASAVILHVTGLDKRRWR
jgi:hypothetical protein